MSRPSHRLTARGVAALTAPGRYADGHGLYLILAADGSKRWVVRYSQAGRVREMGLGPARTIALAEARQRAEAVRRTVHEGRDPIRERRAAAPAPPVPSFGLAAESLMASLGPSWRNAKHRQQWANTLATYARPLWEQPVDAIDTAAVLAVLTPIWQAKPETASRLRGRIERVLDAARVQGWRSGENPARWRGHLDHILPKAKKLSRGHHAALPFEQVPAFVRQLAEREGLAASALLLAILTAARSGEVLGAAWAEFDLSKALWTVPKGRMKGGREHRVPLSGPALALIQALRDTAAEEAVHVFPGQRPGKPLSNMAFAMLLRRMGQGEITSHGFRSAFRDWAGEMTATPYDVAEAALAHAVGSQTERAYRRGDALEKRRRLMEAWARFCCDPADPVVVPLRRPS